MATSNSQPYQQLMVLFSSYVVALREQDFSDETQHRILAKTTSALTKIYTTEVLSKPRKRQGVYRAASTPSHTSKKVPPDQRVQFSTEEVKQLNELNEQIGSRLYSAGITAEQFMRSLTKDGRVTLGDLRDGLATLNLTLSPEEIDLLLRKYNALLGFPSKVNYSEFTHLFPKRHEEDVKENLSEESVKTQESIKMQDDRKDRERPKRALTLNPFPQTIYLKSESDSEASSRVSGPPDPDYMSEDDELSEREPTPPREREVDEETT
jgi:hypothetical protein